MNSVTDYIDTIVFFAFSMYYCSFLYVLTHVSPVTTHVTVCVICHAKIKGYLLTYLLTYSTCRQYLSVCFLASTASSSFTDGQQQASKRLIALCSYAYVCIILVNSSLFLELS